MGYCTCSFSGKLYGTYKDLQIIFYFQIGMAGFVMLLMGTYWATECIPLAVTALLPIVIFPLSGVMDSDRVAMNYLNVSCSTFWGRRVT